MEQSMHSFFTSFKAGTDLGPLPDSLQLYSHPPASACILAIEELQDYLQTQNEWEHNFGLVPNQPGTIIGKMFGVLIVENQDKEIGYLSAFSGKLADRNTFTRFVPPVFDTLAADGFLSSGMKKLGEMSLGIKSLKECETEAQKREIEALRKERKDFSIDLQTQLFESYHFLNQSGEEKSLISIFKDAGYANPPAGAGECAAPKLLQYAFLNQLKPIALTEFWWGQSPKSATWKHQHFYAPCKEKCEPILAHMLNTI
ncbi:MAG: pseudouridylate synthase [Bacteroidia bacterium]